jgi:hypothetical protein
MKKLFLPLVTMLVCLTSFGQLDMVVNEFYGTRSTGEEVYRIYAILEDPTDFISAVYGAGNNSLYIGSDIGGIVNDENGAITGDNLPLNFCPFIADVCFDSYLTIGAAGTNTGEVMYYDGVTPMACASPIIAISTLPSSEQFNLSFTPALGANFILGDGAWFGSNTPGCNDQGLPFGPNNKVLLAQIALPVGGSLEYNLNLQLFNEAVGPDEIDYVWNDASENSNQVLGLDKGLVYPYGNCTDETACNYNEFPAEEDVPAICNYACYGCTDSTACNYDPSVTIDDGSCSNLPGCTDSTASNYDSAAACDDGSCAFDGCLDSSACNFDSNATNDDGSCVLPDGCTNSNAANYDSLAQCDDGSCMILGCTDTMACNFNTLANTDDGSCELQDGCTDSNANNYDPSATCNDGSCEFDTLTTLSIEQYMTHDGIGSDGVDLTGLTTYRVYVNFPTDNYMLSSVYGVNPEELSIASTTTFWQSEFGGATADNLNPAFIDVIPSLEFDSFITIGKENSVIPGGPIVTAGDWPDSFEDGNGIYLNDNIGGAWFVVNGEPEQVINAYPDENLKVLVAQLTTDGEIDACINVQLFPNGDGSQMIFEHICSSSGPSEGCTDSTYCNYDPLAEIEDGSCSDTCFGCTDSLAGNYDTNATDDDGSCLFFGCMDSTAANYDSSATLDDGSCEFPGCTDPLAFNFNANANVDDDSCDYDCEGNVVFLDMGDSFGDGWNGGTWVLTNSSDEIVDSGEMDTAPINDGITASDIFCVPNGCYTFEVGGGSFDEEISWTITIGQTVISGFAPSVTPIDINGDCLIGCQDPGSCNYDSTAMLNYGCDYECVGCTASTACNYEADNTIDDGTCLFEAILEGYVFNDTDQNGVYLPNEFADPGLANWSVEILELGVVAFTDATGYYQFFNVPSGTYTLEATNVEEGWTNSTPTIITTSTIQCLITNQNFGFYPTGAQPFFATSPSWIFMEAFHCEDGYSPGLWVHNIGPVALTGQVTITFDPILGGEFFDGWSSVVNPDELNPGEAIWYLDGSPQAGESLIYQMHIPGPGAEFLGEVFDININLSLTDDLGEEYFNDNWLLQPEVVCSYDPNDKYTEFPGYTDEHHFILKENEMEYRIRFQNEGNWPAQDVIIRDTLDIEHLDLSTFSPAFGSHSFLTCLHPDGAVEFHFDDIYLPALETDEQGSMGFVAFRITPRDNVQPGDVINNTAHIFFDGNDAIVTNTTWHTIYECGEEAAFDLTSPLCLEDEILAQGTHEYVDDYLWTYNGDEISEDFEWSEVATAEGAFEITLTASNLLCDPITIGQFVNVNPTPQALITVDGSTLTASNGQAWQWYLDGVLIQDATEQSFTAEMNGIYSVEVFNEWNCSELSDDQELTSVSIWDANQLSLEMYPNPTSSNTTLYWTDHTAPLDLRIFNALGQIVHEVRAITGSTYVINTSEYTAGYYTIRTIQNGQSNEIKLIVQ